MLKKILFTNYKAFADETAIELRPITVLLGKNSSGKSSVCKLISLLSTAFSENNGVLLPLRNTDVVLGSRYEDLFHNGILSGLIIKAYFDTDVQVETEFLIQEGKLLVKEYQVCHGTSVSHSAYMNVQESIGDSYEGIINTRIFQELGIDNNKVAFHVDYIGPLRKAARRAVFSSDIMNTQRVGYNGENTPYILLDSFLNDGILLKNVSDWYEENMDGQRLVVSENGTGTGSYSFMMRRGHTYVNLADVGEGNNQLLPIITQSFTNHTDISIIEQPALHLHPSAHANIAYRLAKAANETGRIYVVESHSENFLLGLRKMVAKGEINKEDVIVYFIDHDGNFAQAIPIEIEENGELTDWPEGIFEEDFELLKEISRGNR